MAQTPPLRSKSWRAATSKVKRANSMDAFPPLTSRLHDSSSGSMMTSRITKGNGGNGSARKGMLAFFETFRKQAATS